MIILTPRLSPLHRHNADCPGISRQMSRVFEARPPPSLINNYRVFFQELAARLIPAMFAPAVSASSCPMGQEEELGRWQIV